MTTPPRFRHLAAAVIIAIVALVAPLRIASSHTPPEVAEQVDGGSLKLTVELYSEVINDRNAAGAERLIADDAIIHTPRGDFTGPAGLLEYVDSIDRTYPGASFDVTSIVVDGDEIVVEWTMTTTQLDLNDGPTDLQVSSPGETTITVVDGQVVAMSHAERGMAVQPAEELTSAGSANPAR